MAEPRLGPEELDRLEDALEDLEFSGDLSDPSEAVSRRLAEFKTILQASREALPLEPVRSGLLDGVLSEARMSAEDIVTPTAAKAASKKQSFWARLRKGMLLPGLAVAGSAALVLLIVKPQLGSGPVQESDGTVVAKAEPTATETISREGAAAPAASDAKNDAAEALAEEVVAVPEAEPPTEPALARDAEPSPPPPPGAPAASRAAAVDPDPPQADEAPEKVEPASGEGWDAVEDGDAARKGGDCFTARNHYSRALDDGNDSVRARAYVGMGLCKQQEGNSAAAADFFDKAKELDEDAVDFANTQESKGKKPKPSPRKPRRKKSAKAKNSMDFESADPLSGQ